MSFGETSGTSHVPFPAENIHRIPAENPDAAQAAGEYAEALREFFHLIARQFPRFDLILLGMGPDGPAASIFPETTAALERTNLVAAPWVEKFKTSRITLTPPVLNNAACVIFLVSGQEKAETLRAVLQGPSQPEHLLAQVLRPVGGRLLWIVDRAASQLLRR